MERKVNRPCVAIWGGTSGHHTLVASRRYQDRCNGWRKIGHSRTGGHRRCSSPQISRRRIVFGRLPLVAVARGFEIDNGASGFLIFRARRQQRHNAHGRMTSALHSRNLEPAGLFLGLVNGGCRTRNLRRLKAGFRTRSEIHRRSFTRKNLSRCRSRFRTGSGGGQGFGEILAGSVRCQPGIALQLK